MCNEKEIVYMNMNGENNPFYGRNHSEESKKKM